MTNSHISGSTLMRFFSKLSTTSIKLRSLQFTIIALGFLTSVGIIGVSLGHIRINETMLLQNSSQSMLLLISSLAITFLLLIQTFSLSTQTAISHFVLGALFSIPFLIETEWTTLNYSFVQKVPFYSLWWICLILSSPLLFSKMNITSMLSIFTIGYFIIGFTTYTRGVAVTTDDHASVVYRLHLLNEFFPNIPIYNAIWNAGLDWRDFFATGILNVYLIFSPLFYLVPPERSYSIVLVLLVFLLTPASAFFSTRLMGGSNHAAIIAAALGICSHAAWYTWTLSYGSMGFICSTALTPLCVGLLIRIIDQKEKTSVAHLIATCTSLTLCILWSMQAVTFLPLLLIAACLAPKLLTSPRKLTVIILFLAINLTWMIVFIRVSNVLSFVSAEDTISSSSTSAVASANTHDQSVVKGKAQSVSIKHALSHFRENALKLNPLILLLFVPSFIFFQGSREAKIALFATAFWIIFLTTIVSAAKPQLELDRLFIVLALISTAPIAILLTRTTKSLKRNHRYLHHLAVLIIFATILSSALTQATALENKGWSKFSLASKNRELLSELIQKFNPGGRVLFSGFVLHELDDGHLAPLAISSKWPIMASSPVHNLWRYTDIIPLSYRSRGPAGIEEFLDLMNVSMVLAHEPVWRKYFRDAKHQYKEVGTAGRFVAFTRTPFPNTYFLQGKGTIISQTENSIELELETASALLKFRYYPFLEIIGCKKWASHPVGDLRESGLELISLSQCYTQKTITIKSRSPIARVFLR